MAERHEEMTAFFLKKFVGMIKRCIFDVFFTYRFYNVRQSVQGDKSFPKGNLKVKPRNMLPRDRGFCFYGLGQRCTLPTTKQNVELGFFRGTDVKNGGAGFLKQVP